ncbi:MAG: App1 family protein [Saprospiraceae bacterium]
MLDRFGRIIHDIQRGYRKGSQYTSDDPVVIQLYRGYRSSTKLFVQGRVLSDSLVKVAQSDRRWRNFVNAIRRFDSDEVAGARLDLDYLGQPFSRVADAEGYFEVHEDVTVQPTVDPWEAIGAKLTEIPYGKPAEELFAGEVADLSAEASIAIVTDIDDTILQTHVTSLFKLRALYHTLVDNAYTRLSFKGAPALYQALASGPDEGNVSNPTFYLSRSPWNLYDMLEHFLDEKGFPKGPIFLRDVGLPYLAAPSEFGHKEGTILRLIEDFPTLKFVLIGDSGEKDADIYHSVAKRHPDRIAAVIIRNVKNNANAKRIQRMFARIPAEKHFHLVKTSDEAAAHLAELGFLNQEQVQQVREAL